MYNETRFEWDEAKARRNQAKHGVSFEEAGTVFHDDSALFIADPDHPHGEARFILLGRSARMRLLVVCHCDGSAPDATRIISARRATRREAAQYMERLS
ncbi:BrnT family toxin [bacterium]|nr:MAG: BrnT family toxin [bacterium]